MGKLWDEEQRDLRFANSLLSGLMDSSPVNPKTVDFLAFMGSPFSWKYCSYSEEFIFASKLSCQNKSQIF